MHTSHTTRDNHIPALGYRFLTSWYDTALRLTMDDPVFKARLIKESGAGERDRVLDLGCGTGTMTVLLADAVEPGGRVAALDYDGDILGRASAKVQFPSTPVDILRGSAMELPFDTGSFDHVFSSLMFHHLLPDDKAIALKGARRVLKPGGGLHIADWGAPASSFARFRFYGVQMLDGFATTRDHIAGRLPGLIEAAGFEAIDVHPIAHTLFGTVSAFHARTR